MTNSSAQFTDLVAHAAAVNSLPFALVCAVCEQESSWNPWEIRYEPAFFIKYVLPLQEKGVIHTDSEARARAFSWGLMQVMGEVARELGYSDHMAKLCDPATGLAIGTKHLAHKLHEAAGDVPKALQLWNGGSNPNYSSEVLARIPAYQKGNS